VSAPLLLALETSCDETSAAVLRGEGELLGHVIFTQDVHRLYGGVVPELASRAHLRTVDDVVDGALREAGIALDQVDAFAVTAGPGLIGALLVGVAWAKAAAWPTAARYATSSGGGWGPAASFTPRPRASPPTTRR
jgi:N6-L-threonylcarbamoyladenine synthase